MGSNSNEHSDQPREEKSLNSRMSFEPVAIIGMGNKEMTAIFSAIPTDCYKGAAGRTSPHNHPSFGTFSKQEKMPTLIFQMSVSKLVHSITSREVVLVRFIVVGDVFSKTIPTTLITRSLVSTLTKRLAWILHNESF